MIIDLHTRIWNSPDQLGPELSRLLRLRQADRWVRLDASVAALERACDCVDVALVHGFRAERLGAHLPNELVADVVRQSPQRRLGVAGVDPMATGRGGDPRTQVAEAKRLGLIAVNVSPICQGFHPTHSQAMRLYEACAAERMPVFVLRGAPFSASAMLEFGRPSAWDEVARSFPNLPIVIGELGYPWIDEALVLVGKHENVWAELSGIASRPWQLYNALQTALGLGVMEKILFGSGFPYELPARAIENLYSLNAMSHGTQLPSIPRSQLQAVVERDSLGALRIEAEVGPATARSRSEQAAPLAGGPGSSGRSNSGANSGVSRGSLPASTAAAAPTASSASPPGASAASTGAER